MQSWLPLIVLLGLFFFNVPIAFALIGASLFYFLFIDQTIPAFMVVQHLMTSTQSFPLLAIPFFIMVGSIMNHAGISRAMMHFADTLTGHLTGGLAQVNVLLSLLMGGISGSANADAAMQSKILVPEMEKRGYGKAFSAAVTASSSAVSPVIPPGINLIIFALLANVSVHKMFIAGYTPGILMAVALLICVAIMSRLRNYKPSHEKPCSWGERGHAFVKAIPALLIPFGIILGMRFGMFTPTEAGAIAVLLCILIGVFGYRELKFSHFPEILKDTVLGTAAVMLIIIGAMLLGYFMTLEHIPQSFANALEGVTENKYTLLVLINIMLLLLGMFLEGGAALIIAIPLLMPVINNAGIHPIHFGVVMIVNIMIGGITPPFGSMMFTVCSILKVSIQDFVKEVWPFLLSLIAVLLLLTYWENLALFLPNALG
jgi:tripartite ATP-independent transporter DctM subunit